MATVLERIESAKKKVEAAKTFKIQLEERIVNAKANLGSITKQMQELGTLPETIEQDIAKLDEQIEANLLTIETVLKENSL
jgi:septal ring factor EnvC (AmiA/AmiB activator)